MTTISTWSPASRRTMGRRLAASRKRYHLLLQNSPDSVMVDDLQGKILEFNPTAEEITGIPAEEVLGKHFNDLGVLDEEGMERGRREFRAALEGIVRPLVEYHITARDGSRRTVEAKSRVVIMEEAERRRGGQDEGEDDGGH